MACLARAVQSVDLADLPLVAAVNQLGRVWWSPALAEISAAWLVLVDWPEQLEAAA